MNSIQPASKTPHLPRIEPIAVCGSKRRRYPTRLKLAAVRRVIECGESVTAVAEDLGIHRSTLGRWKRQLGADHLVALAALVDKLDAEVGDPCGYDVDPTQAALRAALRGEAEPADWSALLAGGIDLRVASTSRGRGQVLAWDRVPCQDLTPSPTGVPSSSRRC